MVREPPLRSMVLQWFWSQKPLVAMVFQWFLVQEPMVFQWFWVRQLLDMMVFNGFQWSDDGMVTIHRSGLFFWILNSEFWIQKIQVYSPELPHQLNSTSQNYCMGAKSSNIFICPKRILEKSRAKIYKSKALEVHKHLMYINKKFSEHRCCSTNAKRKVRTKKKRKWRSRSLAGQRLVKVSSSKKKKKRKKKGRSKKSSKKKCRRRKNKKSCKKN